MAELILIVIIATFIAGLFFCDREEKESYRWNEMYPPTPCFSITREEAEEFWGGDQLPGSEVFTGRYKNAQTTQNAANRIMSDRLRTITNGA